MQGTPHYYEARDNPLLCYRCCLQISLSEVMHACMLHCQKTVDWRKDLFANRFARWMICVKACLQLCPCHSRLSSPAEQGLEEPLTSSTHSSMATQPRPEAERFLPQLTEALVKLDHDQPLSVTEFVNAVDKIMPIFDHLGELD